MEVSLDKIQENYKRLQIAETLELEKAYRSGDVDLILKAEKYLERKVPQRGNRHFDLGKSIIIDPFNRNANFGYLEKSSNINFNVLRAMSLTPIPRAIINTRKEQLAEFSRPQPDEYSSGFIIRKKRKSYAPGSETKLTKQEEKEIDYITEFVLNCGQANNEWHGDDFESFIRKIVDDSLALDQMTFEPIRSRGGKIVEFIATDAATFRISDSYDQDVEDKAKKINGYYPAYVQVIDGQIRSEFYPWELCFGIRNPQTNIRTNAYGRSELEDLINTVTDLLNAASYNSNYFRIGSNPKGILKVKNLNTSRIDEFKANWLADMAGVRNAHKLPIIDADSLDFINTQTSNKDMEYQKYLEFLIKVACAIYKISPEEIGFPLEGMNSGGLGKGDNKTELEYSKSKGLGPLLRFIEGKINKYVVGPLTDDKYEFVYVGFDKKTEEKELEDDIKKVTNGGMSMQDFFKKYSNREFNMDKDIILNPIFLQYKQMMMMGGEESNQFVDEEFDQEEEEETNPFLMKAVQFVDKELNTNES